MTRGAKRVLLRRRLQEVTADQWADSDLNELLEIGQHLVQKEVMKVRADAFVVEDTFALVANQEFYQLPDGFWYEIKVKFRSNTTVPYGKITRGNHELFDDISSGADTKYDIIGRFITFGPIPSGNVAPGVKILFVPTLSYGSSDATVSQLHLGLHLAVVVWAQMLALGETQESQSEPAALLKSLLADIPDYYHRGGEPQVVRIDAGGTVY